METEANTTEAPAEDGYATNPLSGMDPEMARNPQPLFKSLRDDMPVMAVDMPSGAGCRAHA